MHRYESTQVRVSEHAHLQYCNRVEPIEVQELAAQCREQLQNKEYTYCRDWFIHLAGVWWIYTIEEEENRMVFLTCYGRTNIDMPKAKKWATRFHDSINLTETI